MTRPRSSRELFVFVFALAAISANAQKAPAAIRAQLAEARQQVSSGELDRAEQNLRTLLAQDASALDAHFLLGYVLLHQRHPVESLAEYNAGAQGRTPTGDEWIGIASDYILLKDLPDAEKWLLFASAHDPANADVWYMLGRTQYNQDRNQEAIRTFTRCLELRPRDVRAEYNLGLAYERTQRQIEAIAAYRTAITWQNEASEPDAQPFLDLGTLLFREGRFPEALEAIREAVGLAPRNALANQQLGLVFEALGRYDEAITALQRASAIAPTAEQPHFFLGRIFRRLGRTSDAKVEFALTSELLGSHSDVATPNSDGRSESAGDAP